MNSVTDVWNSVLGTLSQKLTPVAMETWFKDCTALELQDRKIVLCTPNSFRKTILQERFSDIIRQSLFDLFACEFEVQVVTADEADAVRKPASAGPADLANFTFDTFVVGNSNKFAHAAALAVASGQTQNYNPLFIYGNSGLGKTHLLFAISNEARRLHPDYNIVYVKGEQFTNDLILAIQMGKNVEFREKYRNADLFLMDDVQFIAGKLSTQEEFFWTYEALYSANKQIVFTSDRSPKEISLLSDRLQSRFSSGLLADINPPDYETRMAIIRNKTVQLGVLLADDVQEYIAKNLTSNVRQIEGAVKKVKAYQDLMEAPVTVAVAKQALNDLIITENEFVPSPDTIVEEIANFYSIQPEDVKGKNQSRKIALARQISMYLIRRLTTFSLMDIGEYFKRDHSTVISSIRRVEEMTQKDTELAKTIKDITANINSRN